MSTTKQNIVEINGLNIKSNSIYKITNKVDKNAPNGFVREGTTKLPSLGIGNSVPCRFVITNKAKNTGVFDTGFYEESPCYSTMNKEEVRKIVESLRTTIVEPYERKNGKGILDHQNESFWADFGIDLTAGRFFSTNNVDDLLELYISMRGYELTPKDRVGDPKFRESPYCVEDKEKVKSIKDERADNLMTAIGNFGILLASNKPLLINILRYTQLVGSSQKVNPETLKASFYEWLNKSEDNVKKFQAAVQLTEKEETKEIVNLYVILDKLAKTGTLKKVNSEYVYNSVPLGADLKTVAKNLCTNKAYEESKVEILELD